MKIVKEIDEILEKYKINETAKILILHYALKTIVRLGLDIKEEE